jgi:hypothetical protein
LLPSRFDFFNNYRLSKTAVASNRSVQQQTRPIIQSLICFLLIPNQLQIIHHLVIKLSVLTCTLPCFCLGSAWAPCRWFMLLAHMGLRSLNAAFPCGSWLSYFLNYFPSIFSLCLTRFLFCSVLALLSAFSVCSLELTAAVNLQYWITLTKSCHYW